MSEAIKQQDIVKISDIPRSRSERFISTYSNHTESTPGFYEVALLFCHIQKDPQGQPAAEQQAEVVMTWEHAVRVRDLLNRLIERYEVDNGPIRLMKEPPEQEEVPQDT